MVALAREGSDPDEVDMVAVERRGHVQDVFCQED